MGDDLKPAWQFYCRCREFRLIHELDSVNSISGTHSLNLCVLRPEFTLQVRFNEFETALKEIKKSLHDLRNQVMPLLINREDDGK